MQLRTIRDQELIDAVKAVIPNATVITNNGCLQSVNIENRVFIQISSYSIEVAVPKTQTVFRAVSTDPAFPASFEDKSESALQTALEEYNDRLKVPVVFTIAKIEKPLD